MCVAVNLHGDCKSFHQFIENTSTQQSKNPKTNCEWWKTYPIVAWNSSPDSVAQPCPINNMYACKDDDENIQIEVIRAESLIISKLHIKMRD